MSELSNYIEDDWGDNALSGRTNAAEGWFLHPSDGLTGDGDYRPGDALKGVYRPDWTVDDGTPSVSNGALQLSDSDRKRLATPSNLTIGSWECDITVNTEADYYFDFLGGLVASGERIGFHSSPSRAKRGLYKNNGTDFTFIISVSSTSGTGAFNQRFTRASDGTFEWFEDGTSKGTTTENYLPPTPHYIEYDNGGGISDLSIDNLVVK